jgi:hypothetical protein
MTYGASRVWGRPTETATRSHSRRLSSPFLSTGENPRLLPSPILACSLPPPIRRLSPAHLLPSVVVPRLGQRCDAVTMVALEEVAEREARGWSGRLSRQRRCSDATVENRSRRGGIQGGIRGRAGQIVAGAGFRAQATTTLSVGPRLLPRPLTSSKGAEYHLLASPCKILLLACGKHCWCPLIAIVWCFPTPR